MERQGESVSQSAGHYGFKSNFKVLRTQNRKLNTEADDDVDSTQLKGRMRVAGLLGGRH